MNNLIELPADLLRDAEALAAKEGKTVSILVEEGLRALLDQQHAGRGSRASAGAWAREFAGGIKLAPGETTGDVRSGYYRNKHGS